MKKKSYTVVHDPVQPDTVTHAGCLIIANKKRRKAINPIFTS